MNRCNNGRVPAHATCVLPVPVYVQTVRMPPHGCGSARLSLSLAISLSLFLSLSLSLSHSLSLSFSLFLSPSPFNSLSLFSLLSSLVCLS